MLFVLNLKKEHYKFQFGQLSFTHMALLLIVFQSHFLIRNVFEGLIWFLLPISLVTCNDITAYIFGILFGKTPLIKVSPRKTWEGFLGGFMSTVIFGFLVPSISQLIFKICSSLDTWLNFLQSHVLYQYSKYMLNTC